MLLSAARMRAFDAWSLHRDMNAAAAGEKKLKKVLTTTARI